MSTNLYKNSQHLNPQLSALSAGNIKPFPTSFYRRPALAVAPDLLGQLLVYEHPEQGLLAGRIVETEAYMSGDAACHAWHLEKKRLKNPNATGRGIELFGEPGMTYVYLNYGMYWLLNVITDEPGVPGAVLIRAVEPLLGEAYFWKNRPAVKRRVDLTNGPGKLTLAMGISGAHHQRDTSTGPIFFCPDSELAREAIEIVTSPRIGITKAADLPWRFTIRDHPFISPGKPGGKQRLGAI